ncbi:MAG: thioredoxin fold domain-containing protein [Flavobacteriales bacterium]|nr:thioredoxin fold domain-containing protein [Flavobacteriales bacterium]
MKYLFTLVFAIAMGTAVSAQSVGINWMTIEEAVEAQKKEPRKIMVDVYTKWCGPCKMMMKNTFTNPDVINYINANFYAVKFDAEGPDAVMFRGQEFSNPDYNPESKGRNGVHQLSRYWNVRAYPTIVYLDENLNVLQPIPGYKTPQQLELYLTLFYTEAYKDIQTQEQWNEYQANFKPTFQ